MSKTYLKALELTHGNDVSASVIWLHGLGASGHDFAPVVNELDLPDGLGVRFVFPHAPNIPVTVNGGMVMPAWYDLLSMAVEREVDLQQLLASASKTIDLVEREIERGVDSRRIVVAGFSQGGAVAYQAALSYHQPLAGLMTLSTYLATKDSIALHAANREIPILVGHGTQDPVVLPSLGEQAVQWLTEKGFQPEYRTYPMPHSVSIEQIADIGRWLTQVLTAEL